MNERFDQLVTGIVLPLVVGGKLSLARPFGTTALAVGQNERILDPDIRTNLDVARVRRARLLAPVDVLPELNTVDWSIAALLNDLLQVTNHNLGGVLTKSRYSALVSSIMSVCSRIAPAHDLGEVLARHATFARVMELFRTDTTVSWWTGSARFRGEEPPNRLLAWKNLRRVHVESDRVPLARMVDNSIVADEFLRALSMWLHLSPLTDIATMTRDAPAFVWSPSTIALIGVPSGRTLAFRALSRGNTDVVATKLNNARSTLPPELAAQRAVIDEFSLAAIEAFARFRSVQPA
jgi:hypothetical protein